jgi:hypothetical protein
MITKFKNWFCYKIVERGQNCTMWFDGWFGKCWSGCCKAHDWHYMNQDKHNKTKWQVDNELFDCVRISGGLFMACIMWIGNKTFSWHYWNKLKK